MQDLTNNNLQQKPWQAYQAVYVDIPFCVRKCIYCDFPSFANQNEATMERYTELLCKEIRTRASVLSAFAKGTEALASTASVTEANRQVTPVPATAFNPRATIFFGGGTPSVLPLACLERIVSELKQQKLWQQPAEATIEVNPGTADLAKLRAYRELGFDRISFGVQSFNDEELRTIGRIHSAQEALDSIRWAQETGFERISCDLIYGLPGQTMASLQRTLLTAVASGISHISVYGLIVEEGTALERMLDAGQLVLPDEDEAADMYEYIQRFLAEHGFERYEVSNYAKPGQQSRHNLIYWQYQPYLAFGCSATTYTGSKRLQAACDLQTYMDECEKLITDCTFSNSSNISELIEDNVELACSSNKENDTQEFKQVALAQDKLKTFEMWENSSLYNIEELTVQESLSEFMFMGLRTLQGANLEEAQERFDVDVLVAYKKELATFFERGLLYYDESSKRLCLTSEGMEVGNLIFEVFV